MWHDFDRGWLYKAPYQLNSWVLLIQKQEQNHHVKWCDLCKFLSSVWLRESERVITVRDQAGAHLHRWSRCSVYTDSGLIMESTSVPKHCLLRFPLISPHLLKSSWQETCRRGKAPTPPTSYLSLLCLANLSSASSYTNYKCKRLSISMLKEIWLNLIALTLDPFGKLRNTCGGVVNAHLVAIYCEDEVECNYSSSMSLACLGFSVLVSWHLADTWFCP